MTAATTTWVALAVFGGGFLLLAGPKELLGSPKNVAMAVLLVLLPLWLYYEYSRAACESASAYGRCRFD